MPLLAQLWYLSTTTCLIRPVVLCAFRRVEDGHTFCYTPRHFRRIPAVRQLLLLCIYIYIYIYRERERDRYITCIHIYIYIYIYMCIYKWFPPSTTGCGRGRRRRWRSSAWGPCTPHSRQIQSVFIISNRKISNWASQILKTNMLLMCPYCLKFQIARV